ncbi:hypothetical protein AMATHDRAFT_47698 [Amanita thiersii Skay4041]|uniref:MARVEL domain-containing protein n=1 Tax=Amanita thiersii Skay4041 TaxID=703135 RepID=A0A2A9NMX3_9AGAR|nr:hypothetical protein AMATHDRAFT_47698 [Amanita thiersii Skay4041]
MCNAIIASVAVWNQSIGSGSLVHHIYLVFLSAFSLLFIFALLCLELVGKDSITGTVLFECIWVFIFFIMSLAGASAVSSAVNPNTSCTVQNHDACTSSEVLLAFSWVVTGVLFVYMSTFVTVILYLRHEQSVIWKSRLHKLPVFKSKRPLSSEPASPRLSGLRKKPTIVAPIPRRIMPDPETLYPHRFGLGMEYEIEHYHPPSPGAAPPSHPTPQPPSNLMYTGQSRIVNTSSDQTFGLYPQFMQDIIRTLPEPPPTAVFTSDPPSPGPSSQLSPSPPPLGDWPRADALTRQAKPKPK